MLTMHLLLTLMLGSSHPSELTTQAMRLWALLPTLVVVTKQAECEIDTSRNKSGVISLCMWFGPLALARAVVCTIAVDIDQIVSWRERNDKKLQ